jgi:flagellar motor protein MotB
MDNQAKDGTQLFDQARRELVQGNLGMALARALDAADMDHAEATFLVALMYFTGTGIQRNTETASEYANKYLQLLPDGPRKSEARALIDGTIGTANAKNMIQAEAKPDTPAGGSAASNKWVIFAGVAVALLVMFLVGYLVLQKNAPAPAEAPAPAPAVAASEPASEAAAPASEPASEAASAASAPKAVAKPKPKADPNIRSQIQSGDVSITETKNGERIIRSGDLVIRVPN